MMMQWRDAACTLINIMDRYDSSFVVRTNKELLMAYPSPLAASALWSRSALRTCSSSSRGSTSTSTSTSLGSEGGPVAVSGLGCRRVGRAGSGERWGQTRR